MPGPNFFDAPITASTPFAKFVPGRGGQGGAQGSYQIDENAKFAATEAATKANKPNIPGAYWVPGGYNPMSGTYRQGYWGDPSIQSKGFLSDTFSNIGNIAKTVAPLAAVALGANYALPYLMGGEAAAGAAGIAEGFGAGGAGAGIGVAAPAGYAGAADAALATGAALTPAALESLAGTAGYGTSAAAGAGSGAGAYLDTLGATAAGAGAGAAASTPWYLSPTALQTGAGLVGGLIQNAGQRQAASMQSDAAQRAIDLQSSINKQQTELNAPFYSAGITGQNRLMDLLGLSKNTGAADYGKYGKDFSMADYTADPGYSFRLNEGMKQLKHTAAGRGGLISGQTMKGLQDYAQGSASQEYNNAFNRYQTSRANQLQPLGNLQNLGVSAANQQSAALGNYGANVSNLLGQQGQSYAAGALGQGNTINTAIGSGISAYQNNALIDQLRRLNPSTYGSAA